jgi:hypothetical protein
MATKPAIVTQKQLDESGLSLRDFLNKERGLTRKAPEGTKAGVYKPRDSVARKGEELLSKNYVRRDMKDRMDVIDRETQGDFLRAMPNKPRRDPGASGAVGGDYMAESAKSRGVRNMYERGAEEAAKDDGMKRGGKVKGYAKGGVTRADGCITKGHTKGRVL